ncbi:hypothetical protein ACQEU5_10955 [Marinactinospora thermotolerans]|uniref:hypothetical protein n=2 Tax=Marinactinospora thermotolerans TaxID=531310 RepID=UPI003D8D87F6
MPDHYGWCLLAERYAHKWELTYDYDAVMPYRARHRGQPDLVFAATDRELFEVMLSVAEPPSRVRRYVVEAEERQRAEELAALNDLVFMAPGGAW